MAIRTYVLRYVHKVSQRCKCGRAQYDHSTPKVAPKYPGERTYGEGPCEYSGCSGYEPETEIVQLPDGIPGDRSAVARTLQKAKLLTAGTRLSEVRRESDGKIVCFPVASIWHSLIFIPQNDGE